MASVLLEARPYRPFKSSEEYLEAMKEDLAEWLGILYPNLMINADNFMERLDTGVALCKHANNVRQAAEDYLVRRQARNKSMTRSITSGIAGPILAMGTVHYLPAAKSGTFFARDNVSNFITWCRKSLKIFECLLFETDDLIMRKNEKHVILCLLEVARRGAKFGMLAPMLVQMERQIDREIAADNKANGIGCGTQTDDNNTNNKSTISTETELYESDSEDEDDNGPMLIYGPQPQIITNDLKSLDEMVRDLVEKCTCPSQFPMVRVSEGKYRIGDTKVLIFVRILRSHVMVRVGGGWDTLSHYLDKHDPCRCKLSHRSSVAARLIPRTNQQTNGIELHKAQVIYERSPPSARKVITSQQSPGHSTVNGHTSSLSPPAIGRGRSRSPTPQRKYLNQINSSENHNAQEKPYLHHPTSSLATTNSPSDLVRRSMSPNQKRLTDIRKKQISLEAQSKLPSNGLINGSNVDVSSSPPPSTHISNHVQFDSLDINTNDTKLELSSSTQSASPSNGLLVTANTSSSNAEGSTKFENISDNGSEISDEGYRSLGVIQSNAQKRESLHSQTSVDDVDNNGRLDQNSSDSQLSPMENNKTAENLKSNNSSTELLDTITSSTPSPPQSKLTEAQEHFNRSASEESESNKFEISGIFITEDDITVDIASTTGLRKTGFSNRIYGGDEIPFTSLPVTLNDTNNTIGSGQKKVLSKIPRSPVPIRRRSVDNISVTSGDLQQRTGLPIFNRKQPVYRSVRTANETTKMNPKKSAIKDVTNTWSGGRQNTTTNNNNNNKKRPSITSDTFMSPSHSPSNFDRNTKNRSSSSSSHILYDSNGRRVRGNSTSLTTSPVKSNSSNGSSSPLAQQLLEAASNAKNDAQILDKMKKLLSKYSMGSGNGVNSKQRKSDFDDFTTAWVHSNGNLERSSSCSPPTKQIMKRNSSAASSNDSTHSRDMASLQCLPRNRMDHRGISKIPAPITRQNTELC